MKTRFVKAVLTLALALLSLPMQSQNYLKIYFKDGHTERHLMSLIDELSTSKYDIEGVLHSDYVSQVVKIKGEEHIYALEDIDSITFRKIDVEKVAEEIANVLTTITTLIEGVSSPDFKQVGEVVSKMAGVEEVLYENDAMIVKTKDWRNIVYEKTPDVIMPVEYPTLTRSPIGNSNTKSSVKVNNSVKVAITNQFINHEGRTLVDDYCQYLKADFESLGYKVDYIKELDYDFFYSGIFDYDIILLETHGLYYHGKHWLLTNDELMVDQSFTGFFGELVNLTNEVISSFHDDIDDVCYYCIDEKRNGKTVWVYYTAVSEDYIRKSTSGFDSDAIIFASACSSLKKTQELPNIFFEKGASVYIGYDNTAYYGHYAGPIFFDNMLDGKSVIQAYNHIPSEYLKEQDTFEKANLLLLTKNNDYESQFITKTITAPNTEVEDKLLDKGKHQITLKGYTSALGNDIECGFIISGNPDMSDSQSGACDIYGIDNNHGNRYFEIDISASSGMTIYYRAYTFDGIYHNYGDICEYTVEQDQEEPDEPTTDKELMLSESVDGVDYKIYKKILDASDYHENPDGWKCYRSELSLETTANGSTNTIVLDNKIYLDDSKGHHGGQYPCILIDHKKDLFIVFCNSKDADYQYSMDCYSYVSSIKTLDFHREKVLDRVNMGWYPYFEENSEGLPAVSHFSYAGYYAMQSIRNDGGAWNTVKGSKINPGDFETKSKKAGQILVIYDDGGEDNPPGGDDNPSTSCPAKITSVELINAGYLRNEEHPNRLYFNVNAKLDNLTGIEEWGVYVDYDTKVEMPFKKVESQQTKTMAYSFKQDMRNDELIVFDLDSYVVEWADEVGVYVKRRDSSSGELTTIYGDKYQFKLRYDTKPSMVLSDPVIVGTEVTGTENGYKKYKTTITYKYDLKGAFWIDYVDSAVSGGEWSFDGFDETWYPEYDHAGESEWVATYSEETSELNHTNWRRLHLRNYGTINSNYVNFTGNGTLTEAWVTSNPVYSRARSNSDTAQKCIIREVMIPVAAPDVKAVTSYKGGSLGEVAE